jgi:hypothetical protein
MNAERLLEIVELLRWKLEKYRVYEPMAELKQSLEQEQSSKIQPAKNKLFQMLSNVPSNFLSPSRRLIINILALRS